MQWHNISWYFFNVIGLLLEPSFGKFKYLGNGIEIGLFWKEEPVVGIVSFHVRCTIKEKRGALACI